MYLLFARSLAHQSVIVTFGTVFSRAMGGLAWVVFLGGGFSLSRCVSYLTRNTTELFPEINKMLDTVRQRTAEDIILQQFGPEARRVFRMLIYKKKLESRQASDYSMLPQKKTREMLYNLYEHGFATVQVRSGGDREEKRICVKAMKEKVGG